MSLYEPQEDSFLLAKYVRKYAHGKVLDMCTGSGIQAHAALQNKKVKSILAVDSNPEAITQLKKQKIPALQSNLFTKVKGTFDTIICNPPYLPSIPNENTAVQKAVSGGKKGNEFLSKFLQGARKHLATKGIILIVISSLTPDAEQLFKMYGYKVKLLEQQNFFFERITIRLLSPQGVFIR